MYFGCSVDEPVSDQGIFEETDLQRMGATQISAVGYFADETQCDYAGQGADFAIIFEGDLEGCLFIFVEDYECSPSGTYREEGRELFVGSYLGEPGTFETTYFFHAKYEGCSEDGFFLGAEIFGFCQHPLVSGSGSGVFDGVEGRFKIKDEVETGAFNLTGQLRF